MELNQQQITTATTLKGSGLFPSQIADKLGLPRGAVRKFFKEKRRIAMMQNGNTEKEYGPGPRVPVVTDDIIEMKPVSQSTRHEEIRALSGDGSNYTFEGVKHAQAQGVKFGEIAEAWGYTMPELRSWMAGEGGKRYTASKQAAKATPAITVVNPKPPVKRAWTEEDKAAATAMMASGVAWRTVAAHFNLPLRTVNMWRIVQIEAAEKAEREAAIKRYAEPVIQPVTPVPVFVPDAATTPVFAIPEPVIALPQTAPLPAITNHAAVALAWTGYAAWMTRDGVKPLMFTEVDVDMLMKVYNTVVAGK